MFLPKQIVALGKIVAKAASRCGPSSVRIERHERGPRAMATDGRRAVVFSWDEPEADKVPPIEGLSSTRAKRFAASVPPKVLTDAGRGITKRRPAGGANPHLLLDETDPAVVQIAASANGKITRTQARVEEASFPDCNAVSPTPAREGKVYEPARHGAAAFTHTRIGVNAKQLAQTLQVVCDLAADDSQSTVIMTVPVDPHRPIRLDARCDGRRAAAAIMPVNADFKAYDEQPPEASRAVLPTSKPRRRRKIQATVQGSPGTTETAALPASRPAQRPRQR
jgi:hypothetical protein